MASGLIIVDCIGAAVLLAALVAPSFRQRPDDIRSGQADAWLPSVPDGWDVREIALAETEGRTKAVSRILDFDSYVFREYSNGVISFDVYIVHWRAGKIPVAMVAGHTPDVCWVNAGWKQQAAVYGDPTRLQSGSVISIERRKFESPLGRTRDVWFWHVGGRAMFIQGRPLFTGAGGIRWRLRDLWTEFCQGTTAQYIVRISSATPLNDLLKEPFVLQMFEALASVGCVPTAVPNAERGGAVRW